MAGIKCNDAKARRSDVETNGSEASFVIGITKSFITSYQGT